MDFLKSLGNVLEVAGKATVVAAAAAYLVKELTPVVSSLLDRKSGE